MDSVGTLFQAFAYNFSLQLLGRCCSFGINFYLLRVVDKEILGVANVRLTLLYTTILFLGREPFRRACLSVNEPHQAAVTNEQNKHTKARTVDEKQNSAAFVNLLWLCPVFSALLCVLTYVIWTTCLPDVPESVSAKYNWAAAVFALSAFLETLAEPFWILAQKAALVKYLAFVQAVHVLLQRVFIAVFVFTDTNSDHLEAFTYAMVTVPDMLISSVFYLSAFAYQVVHLAAVNDLCLHIQNVRALFPVFGAGLDTQKLIDVKSWLLHSVVKQLLTDGAQYVMSFVNVLTFAEQGVYDAIEKLGSLVARTLLKSLEDSAYVYFAVNIDRNQPANRQNPVRAMTILLMLLVGPRLVQVKYREAIYALGGLLRSTAIVGMIVCVFGCSYAYLALLIYGGPKLTQNNGANILRAYSVYVWLLAINGVTECFAFATMKAHQVTSHGNFLACLSVVYLLAHALVVKYTGAVGFVLVNAVNMLLRIIYSLRHIHRFTSAGQPVLLNMQRTASDGWSDPNQHSSVLWQLVPTATTFGALFISLFCTLLSSGLFCCEGVFNTAIHLVLGMVAFALTCLAVNESEFELYKFAERVLFHDKVD